MSVKIKNMLRWDEIFSLPVQSPPTLEFSAADLVWSKVVGWRDKIDRVARIPYPRVGDFVRGESANEECPTRFHVEARRKRPPEMHCKQKVDGILEYILYWCSFGPDDHRKGGIVRPSRSTYVPKKKSAGRPNTKRGCVCHFIVKRLIADPSIALIIYNQDKHVDKSEQPCHGPQDQKSVGTRAAFAPYISDDFRLRVLSLLHVGVSVETIMQRHNEFVEKQGGPRNRDDLLTHRYVRRLERSIRRSNYELDEDDMVSIGMWVESHQSHVFFYEDFTDEDPFVLGIQTEWQLQQMIRFGNNSLVVSDSRFGMNKLKYPILSLLVFDSENKTIPVAWILTSRFGNESTHKWVRALYKKVHSKDPTWKLGGFVVDDPSADVHAIREVFHCSILICFWRVRHAWHKHLVKKCPETEMRCEMFKRLGQAVYSVCQGNGDLNLFKDFMEDFVDCPDFLEYFKANWLPRIGLWISALKNLPLASQETCAALECYHHQLKLRLLNEKEPKVYQRTDWLVEKLSTKVHSYFWLDGYKGKEDFARYRKDEWMSGLTSWRRALQIPDADVTFEGGYAKVISQHDQEKAHFVWNPGCEFAMCDCNWSRMGNLCKHIIKVSKICRSKGSAKMSISLYKYRQTLINMLHCPPHDSLIRDHAISLAVCVQMQLNSLIGPESCRSEVHSVEKQSTGTGPSNSRVEEGNLRNDTADSTSEMQIDHLESENGVCGEVEGELIGSSEMDVDQLHSNYDRVIVTSNVQSENILSSVGTDSSVGGESQGYAAGNTSGEKVSDQVASENVVHVEVVEKAAGTIEIDDDTSPSVKLDPHQVQSSGGNFVVEKDMNLNVVELGKRKRTRGSTSRMSLRVREAVKNVVHSIEKQSTGTGPSNSRVEKGNQLNDLGGSTSEMQTDRFESENGACDEVEGDLIGSNGMDVDQLHSSNGRVVVTKNVQSESILSSVGTDSTSVGGESQGYVAGDTSGEKVSDQVAKENVVCVEAVEKATGSIEIDDDTSPSVKLDSHQIHISGGNLVVEEDMNSNDAELGKRERTRGTTSRPRVREAVSNAVEAVKTRSMIKYSRTRSSTVRVVDSGRAGEKGVG
ncbi:hypothetical protein C5167_018732 [Papaver somniferum]|uniref:SWIM-type domain-containing protein n=2 Tax=Papaver somniferum TaxID=3469 RepID=A0A4Y7IR90_PAPSO|nr:hypothetical protein C5167_018732 [Papaver somniferum]